jgi:anti-sigma factor RsiW
MADEKLLERLSAYADGELDTAERARVEAALATEAGLRRLLAQFRQLDTATAALPVPEMPANAAEAAWSEVLERVKSPAPPVASERIIDALPDPPVIPNERWKGVWDGIRQQTQSMPAVRGEPLDADLTPVGMTVSASERHAPKVEEWKRPIPLWRAIAALSVAATVLVALTLLFAARPDSGREISAPSQYAQNPSPDSTQVLDDARYSLSIKHLPGVPTPVVCFFLKDPDAELDQSGNLWE